VNLPRFNFPIGLPGSLTKDFISKASETNKGMQAADSAMGELSLKCNLADSRRALYLVSGPAKEMNMELMKQIGSNVKRAAPEALIRSGDYPREKNSLQVTVIFSELVYLGKVMDYFNRVIAYLSAKSKRKSVTLQQQGLEEAFRDIPSLL
jgi:cell division GTPase FtsZ